MDKKQLQTLKILSGITVGFSLFWLTSHPTSKVKNKLPKKSYKNVVFLPNLQYHKGATIYHFHHWMVLSVVYVTLMQSKKLRKSHTFHGLFLGGILQGLLYNDRFTFRYPKVTSS